MERIRAGVMAIAVIVACSAMASAADPAGNRKASANYDAVVHDNPGFRADREHAECDSIQSLDLRAQCVASFDRSAPIRPTGIETAAPPADIEHPLITITNGPVRNPDDD
jgi:hypothetical protein